MKIKLVETTEIQKTAILVAVITQKQTDEQAAEYLEELEFLAETAGVKTIYKFKQKLDRPDGKFFVGKGKMDEIIAYIKEYKPDLVIFDDELSSSQIRNLEKILTCSILDRSLLIIQIFMQRARTAQARTQVELAQFEYVLPRLTRMWTHLSRQQGGKGTRGGPGEKEIETDRRIVRDRIALLKEKLKDIEKISINQRKSRDQMVRVALVGYTNVGKSTLMNLLAKSDIFAENKLFATVDSTVRKVVFKETPFLLADTVGFIRKLPTTLIEAFKSTLAEVVEADILLHVIDISHPAFEEQIEIVSKTLAEIGASDKSVILVFNKIDQYKNPEIGEFDLIESKIPTLEALKQMYLGKLPKAIFISAVQKENISELRELLFREVAEKYYTIYPNYLKQDVNLVHILPTE